MATHNYQTPLTNREWARIAVQQHTRRSFCEALDLVRLRYSSCPELPVPSGITISAESAADYEAIKKAFPNGKETLFIDGQYRIWRVQTLGVVISFQFMDLRAAAVGTEANR